MLNPHFYEVEQSQLKLRAREENQGKKTLFITSKYFVTILLLPQCPHSQGAEFFSLSSIRLGCFKCHSLTDTHRHNQRGREAEREQRWKGWWRNREGRLVESRRRKGARNDVKKNQEKVQKFLLDWLCKPVCARKKINIRTVAVLCKICAGTKYHDVAWWDGSPFLFWLTSSVYLSVFEMAW